MISSLMNLGLSFALTLLLTPLLLAVYTGNCHIAIAEYPLTVRIRSKSSKQYVRVAWIRLWGSPFMFDVHFPSSFLPSTDLLSRAYAHKIGYINAT